MDLESIINSSQGIRTGLALARVMPRSAGYALARFLAGRIASRRDQPMVRAVRSNQWVISDGALKSKELDEAVARTFRNRAYSIFDLYHNLQKPERMLEAVEFGPEIMELVARSKRREEGMVVVLPHVSNYELAGLAAGLHGGKGVALTLPEQPGGYQHHDEIRRRFGIEAMPTSMASFKYASQLLGEGGVVATGIDRPLPGSSYEPMFFGRKTPLPVHHVVLALRAQVPILIACVNRQSDGRYGVFRPELIPMEKKTKRKTEILTKAEQVLEIAEVFIRRDPQQWAMFFPVWPDVVPEPLDD